MIRIVIYLAVIGLLALGAGWLADRPGDVAITWLGHRIETSVMVLAMAVIALTALAVTLWSAVSALLRSPGHVGRHLRARRGARGYRAVSQGTGRCRLGRCGRRAQIHGGGKPHRAGRAAHSPAAGADRAAVRRPRRSGPQFRADGGARRHQAARAARTVRRGAAAQRPDGGAASCRGGGQAQLGARMGGACGARIPLYCRRLERRPSSARAQHKEQIAG